MTNKGLMTRMTKRKLEMDAKNDGKEYPNVYGITHLYTSRANC
jgi:hypothetical protein